jgi:hypothetical protein
MITIHGLSKRQIKLAQLLWSVQDVEQHRLLMQSLQGRDRVDAQGLTEIMIQEFLWETLDDDYESKELCHSVIDRARSS